MLHIGAGIPWKQHPYPYGTWLCHRVGLGPLLLLTPARFRRTFIFQLGVGRETGVKSHAGAPLAFALTFIFMHRYICFTNGANAPKCFRSQLSWSCSCVMKHLDVFHCTASADGEGECVIKVGAGFMLWWVNSSFQAFK